MPNVEPSGARLWASAAAQGWTSSLWNQFDFYFAPYGFSIFLE